MRRKIPLYGGSIMAPATALLVHPIGWVIAGGIAIASLATIGIINAIDEADARQKTELETAEAIAKQRAAETEAETVRRAAATLREQATAKMATAEAAMRTMMGQLAEAKAKLAQHGEKFTTTEPDLTAWKL
jgi:hypothetical protein